MKTNQINTNTLTFKLWLYFISFAIALFVILWFMQVIFIQSYYSSMKKNEIDKLVSLVELEYINGDYLDKLENIAYKNASTILLLDLNGNVKYTSGSTTIQGNTSPLPTRPITIDTSSIVDKVLENANQKTSYTLKIERFKSEIYVSAKIIPNSNTCLAVITSIDPIDSTTNVLKGQLIYVTAIALLISSIISVFLSKRISHPIQEMTKTANKLARGNYDIEFKEAGYKEIDELADTLNYATIELGKTDKVRKELIANVSHDLKTPLTMIKAYSEMIRDLSGENKEKREEHLQVIIDETDRLTRLVGDMMDLSRIESGFASLTKTIFNMSDVVKSIVNGFDIMQNEKCSIKLDIPSDAYVLADKTKIEQVVYNLVANAINHSGDDKKIKVKISSSGRRVLVQVNDNGPGIPKENIPHIWNRYYKATNTFIRTEKGSGLGLSIVKNILDKHKSNFGVESIEGKGSTFWFDLEKANKRGVKEIKDVK